MVATHLPPGTLLPQCNLVIPSTKRWEVPSPSVWVSCDCFGQWSAAQMILYDFESNVLQGHAGCLKLGAQRPPCCKETPSYAGATCIQILKPAFLIFMSFQPGESEWRVGGVRGRNMWVKELGMIPAPSPQVTPNLWDIPAEAPGTSEVQQKQFSPPCSGQISNSQNPGL